MRYEDMAISVTELNSYIKNKIADDEYLNNVLVKGEISNFKNHYTGHMYFPYLKEMEYIKYMLKLCKKMVLEFFIKNMKN